MHRQITGVSNKELGSHGDQFSGYTKLGNDTINRQGFTKKHTDSIQRTLSSSKSSALAMLVFQISLLMGGYLVAIKPVALQEAQRLANHQQGNH